MKIYVDKLPPCCGECLFYGRGHNKVIGNYTDGCIVLQIAVNGANKHRKLIDCPLAELPLSAQYERVPVGIDPPTLTAEQYVAAGRANVTGERELMDWFVETEGAEND